MTQRPAGEVSRGGPASREASRSTSQAAAEWERHARWWQANFTEGADPEYSELMIPLLLDHLDGHLRRDAPGTPPGAVPATTPMVLDVGTGEGQVARAVADGFGWPVLGCDLSWAQVSEARGRGGGPVYLRSSATELAVRESSVDAVVACLLLEHVEDLEGALGELARVLRPGGCLLVVINHPIVAAPGSGWIDDHLVDPPEQYWQLGPYLPEATTVEMVARDVHITFHHRPLSRYLNTAWSVGLTLTHMVEPPPPAAFVELTPEYTEQTTMPRMMLMQFTRM